MNIFDYINTTPVRKWTHIMIHHSATKDGLVPDWEAIRQYHKNVNKWSDIGYHLGIDLIGERYEYQVGRPLDAVGIHTKGMNEVGIGICLIGNYDITEVKQEQYFLLASICRSLMLRCGIPIYNIMGHNNYADKTCPGKNFNLTKFKYQYIKI